MSDRLDVRRMLLKRGWTADTRVGRSGMLLRCGGSGRTMWAPSNGYGDSSVSRYDAPGSPTIQFPGDVPARAVVAACVALAADTMADVAGAL